MRAKRDRDLRGLRPTPLRFGGASQDLEGLARPIIPVLHVGEAERGKRVRPLLDAVKANAKRIEHKSVRQTFNPIPQPRARFVLARDLEAETTNAERGRGVAQFDARRVVLRDFHARPVERLAVEYGSQTSQ